MVKTEPLKTQNSSMQIYDSTRIVFVPSKQAYMKNDGRSIVFIETFFKMSRIKLKEKEHKGSTGGTFLIKSFHLEILEARIKLLCF